MLTFFRVLKRRGRGMLGVGEVGSGVEVGRNSTARVALTVRVYDPKLRARSVDPLCIVPARDVWC